MDPTAKNFRGDPTDSSADAVGSAAAQPPADVISEAMPAVAAATTPVGEVEDSAEAWGLVTACSVVSSLMELVIFWIICVWMEGKEKEHREGERMYR